MPATGPRIILYSPAAPTFKDTEWTMIIRQSSYQRLQLLYNVLTLNLYNEYVQLSENKVRNVKAHVRRRWPGGPTSNVPGSDVPYVRSPAVPGLTLPGDPAWIVYRPDFTDWNPLTNNPNSEEIQFTINGNWGRFYLEMSALSKISHVLISPHGRKWYMPKAIVPVP
jgi:hypothetical protein